MTARTVGTPKGQLRSFNVMNTTDEVIPPYGVMQITRKPLERELDLDQWADLFSATEAAYVHRFDNQSLIYVRKPDRALQAYQDHSVIAFNGDMPIPKKSRGTGYWGNYPVKAKTTGGGTAALYSSLAIVADSWALHRSGVAAGAFVGLRISDENEHFVSPNVAVISQFSANGSWEFSGAETKPMVVGNILSMTSFIDSEEESEDQQDEEDNDFLFGREPTLTLRIPGRYTITWEGEIKPKEPPQRSLRLDYHFQPEYEGGESSTVLWTATDGTSKYGKATIFKTKADHSIVVVNSSSSNSNNNQDPYNPEGAQWYIHTIRMTDIVEVRDAPVKVYIKQTGTPYVEGSGTWNLTYNARDPGMHAFYNTSAYWGWGGSASWWYPGGGPRYSVLTYYGPGSVRPGAIAGENFSAIPNQTIPVDRS